MTMSFLYNSIARFVKIKKVLANLAKQTMASMAFMA